MEPQQNQLTPDEAKAALGLSTRLTEQHLQSQVQPQTAPVEPQNAPQPQEPAAPAPEPTQPQEAPKEENDETAQVVVKVQELEDKHTKELEELKKSIDNENLEAKIKKGYEKKIADMEKAHAKEMKGVKDEIKNILNG